MSTMKAAVLSGTGDDSVELATVAVPSNGPDELLVQNKAIGVGIHDSYFLPSGVSTPFPIGIEAAGVVERVGSELAGRHRPGDRIAYVSTNQRKGGTWAEYAVVAAGSLIIAIPEDMAFEQAAAIPVAGNTTLRALHALPPMPRDGSIFVAGASGAIGTFAVQLGRARGWDVAGSASPRNHDYLASLGAGATVDYHDPGWPEQIRRWMPGGVDAALAVQPGTTSGSAGVVTRGGTVVTISGDRVARPPNGVTVAGLAYHVDVRDELVEVVDQIRTGRLRLEIERSYPFEAAPAALQKVQTRHARGKIVLSLS